MFRILDCLTTQHDWRLVAVAGVVCFLASLTAITLFHRARSTKGRARTVWLAAAGAATGCGIWATHFLAMLAYQPGMPVAYDINLTIVSLLAAGVITAIGLAVAVFTPRRWGAPIGGGIIGGGVAAMHYLGMEALQLPGHIHWDLALVAASIVLGMVLGMASLMVAVRLAERARGMGFGAAVGARHPFASLHGHGGGGSRSRSHPDDHRARPCHRACSLLPSPA